MPDTATHNIDTIIDGQLYIGKYAFSIAFLFGLSHSTSLSAAKSLDLRRLFGITHIVSACPDYPLQGPNHLTLPVQDSEYEDILIHLPETCRFIRSAINGGGRVLVHCLMGISRSATIVAAYCEDFRLNNRLNLMRN